MGLSIHLTRWTNWGNFSRKKTIGQFFDAKILIRGNYPKKGRIQVLDTGILVRLPMSKTIRHRLSITESGYCRQVKKCRGKSYLRGQRIQGYLRMVTYLLSRSESCLGLKEQREAQWTISQVRGKGRRDVLVCTWPQKSTVIPGVSKKT